jgi:hypothetical protein
MAKIIFSREAHAAKNIVANLGLSLVSVRLSLSLSSFVLLWLLGPSLSLFLQKSHKNKKNYFWQKNHQKYEISYYWRLKTIENNIILTFFYRRK